VVELRPSSSLSTGCVVSLREDWAIFCHAGSGRVGRVRSVREKSLEILRRGWELNPGHGEDRQWAIPLSYHDRLTLPQSLSPTDRYGPRLACYIRSWHGWLFSLLALLLLLFFLTIIINFINGLSHSDCIVELADVGHMMWVMCFSIFQVQSPLLQQSQRLVNLVSLLSQRQSKRLCFRSYFNLCTRSWSLLLDWQRDFAGVNHARIAFLSPSLTFRGFEPRPNAHTLSILTTTLSIIL